MPPDHFICTVDAWIDALPQYSFRELCIKPGAGSWSLGQLYLHLLADTHFYFEQVALCITANEHAMQEKTAAGSALFLNNAFPDEIIAGHPDNALIPQPENKEQLLQALLDLKSELVWVDRTITENPYNGKIKHPGFGYLNAAEWFKLAEMHFRHHLRQKKRIEAYLIANKL